MLAFVLRRLFQAALVMLVVAFVAFSLFNYAADQGKNGRAKREFKRGGKAFFNER